MPETAVSVIQACQYLTLFQKIADAAGKNLTVASFTKAGYALKNASIPGTGGGLVSFGRQPALRHRSHHGGDLQPGVEDAGACFGHGEVTRARFTVPHYVDGGDAAGWIPGRRWGLD